MRAILLSLIMLLWIGVANAAHHHQMPKHPTPSPPPKYRHIPDYGGRFGYPRPYYHYNGPLMVRPLPPYYVVPQYPYYYGPGFRFDYGNRHDGWGFYFSF